MSSPPAEVPVPPLPIWIDPTSPLLAYLAAGGLGIGVLGLLAAVAAHRRIGRLRAAYRLIQGDAGPEDVVTAVSRQVAEMHALRAEFTTLRRQTETTRTAVADALRHVAVVRYDAFGDMGGRLSFSAALLDDAGTGVVFTAINGRQETRTYAKSVTTGHSETPLSPEEQRVVDSAREGGRSVTLPDTAQAAARS